MSCRFVANSLAALLGSAMLLATGTIAEAVPNVVPAVPGPADRPAAEVKSESPEEVYAAFIKSLRTGDYAAFITRVTPNKGAYITFELVFETGMQPGNVLDKYLDSEFSLEAHRKAGGRLSVEQNHAVITASIKDKRAFFRYVTTEFAKDLKEETDQPLRKVVIKGDRARGVITRYIESLHVDKDGRELKSRKEYDSPVYFARSEHTWLIDNPTREEAEQNRLESNKKYSGGPSPYGHPTLTPPPAPKKE